MRFSVVVQAGITAAQTAMNYLRDALANVGVGLDIVALDQGGVMGAWQQGKNDPVFHFIQVSDTDPGGNLDLWLSRSSSHLWHPGRRRRPRRGEPEIDRRMLLMASTLDPHRARARVHRGAAADADPQPGDLVRRASRVRRDAPARLRIRPRLTRPQVLWRAEELYRQN